MPEAEDNDELGSFTVTRERAGIKLADVSHDEVGEEVNPRPDQLASRKGCMDYVDSWNILLKRTGRKTFPNIVVLSHILLRERRRRWTTKHMMQNYI